MSIFSVVPEFPESTAPVAVAVDPTTGATWVAGALSQTVGDVAGALVVVEARLPTSTTTLYTVPATKTFTGGVTALVGGTGTVEVKVGTEVVFKASSVITSPVTVPVEVTAGDSGTAVKVILGSDGTAPSVVVYGYVS